MRAPNVADRLHSSHRAPTSETPPQLVAPSWSEREDDGSANLAAGCLGERLGCVGEGTAGGDRNLNLSVPEPLRELAQLVSVGADVEVGDRDSALLAGRVLGDSRKSPAIGHRPDRASRAASCRIDRGGHSVTSRYRADLLGP